MALCSKFCLSKGGRRSAAGPALELAALLLPLAALITRRSVVRRPHEGYRDRYPSYVDRCRSTSCQRNAVKGCRRNAVESFRTIAARDLIRPIATMMNEQKESVCQLGGQRDDQPLGSRGCGWTACYLALKGHQRTNPSVQARMHDICHHAVLFDMASCRRCARRFMQSVVVPVAMTSATARMPP